MRRSTFPFCQGQYGENEGEPFSHTVYATSVHIREDGRWRGAFHQQTLVV